MLRKGASEVDLPALEAIDVGFAQITDNGIDLFTRLERLRELTIGVNKLTDTGLDALRLMPTLKYHCVTSAKCSKRGSMSFGPPDVVNQMMEVLA